MPQKTNLYNEAVKVSEDYLGPAGERFIRRQIATHLQIQPELLQKRHLPELAEWLHAAFAVLTNDAQYVTEYINQILRIGNTNADNSVKVTHGDSQ